jgi:anti-anti-sigma factor
VTREVPLPVMVTVTAGQDRVVIHVQGELDEACGEQLQDAARSLDQTRPRRIELDLSGVTGADLAGVRAVQDLRTSIEDTGAELVIHDVGAQVYPIDWHAVPRTNRFFEWDEQAEVAD